MRRVGAYLQGALQPALELLHTNSITARYQTTHAVQLHQPKARSVWRAGTLSLARKDEAPITGGLHRVENVLVAHWQTGVMGVVAAPEHVAFGIQLVQHAVVP